MSDPSDRWNAATVSLVVLATLAVLLFMRMAQAVVMPMLMAVLLAVVAEAGVQGLCRLRIPRLPAVLLVVLIIALVLVGVGYLVGSSVQQLTERAPVYQSNVEAGLKRLLETSGNSRLRPYVDEIVAQASPGAAVGFAARLLAGVRDLFANAFLIFFLVIFILLEVPLLRSKLDSIGGAGRAWTSIAASVRGYLAIKSITSLATGLLVGALLVALDIDFAILWGILAFLLNYIPQIGSILAAIPPFLVALLQQGPGVAIVVAIGFGIVNLVIGNFLEPRIMGSGLGLSTLVVVVSLVLWGWLLGPVGMLLSVPLTTALRLALEVHPDTRGLARFLGRGVDLGEPAA